MSTTVSLPVALSVAATSISRKSFAVPTPPCPPAVPAVMVMFIPVTSIVGRPSASTMPCGEKSVTSLAVELIHPTRRSPLSSVSVIEPFVCISILATSVPIPSSFSTGGTTFARSVNAVNVMVVPVSVWRRLMSSPAVRSPYDEPASPKV